MKALVLRRVLSGILDAKRFFINNSEECLGVLGVFFPVAYIHQISHPATNPPHHTHTKSNEMVKKH